MGKCDLYNLIITDHKISIMNYFLFSALLPFELSKDIIGFYESNPCKEEKIVSLISILLIIKVLRIKEVNALLFQIIAKVWLLFLIEDLNSYFPDMKENDFSEREYFVNNRGYISPR